MSPAKPRCSVRLELVVTDSDHNPTDAKRVDTVRTILLASVLADRLPEALAEFLSLLPDGETLRAHLVRHLNREIR